MNREEAGDPPPPDELGGEITRWLEGVRKSEPGALDRVVGLLYDELRRLARQRLRGERTAHTLDTTALVHEAYLRLFREPRINAETRSDFFAIASNTMWRVLVDYARSRRRQKRGGGEALIPLEEVEAFLTEAAAQEVLELDPALARLRALQPRAAAVVEMHFFGGLTMEEIGSHLGVSPKTVQRDWQAARAWLRKEVAGAL